MARPKSFDPDLALDRAMNIFWKHGYEGATMPLLCKAMGINKPSLYAAFGSKRELFTMAADRYDQTYGQYFRNALEAETSRGVIEQMLHGAIQIACDKRTPGGCLNVQTGVALGVNDASVRREMIRRRSTGERLLRERLEQAKSDGDLPRNADPAALARYTVVVIRGIAITAADGAKHDELMQLVDIALRGWPDKAG